MSWNQDLSRYCTEVGSEFQYFSQGLDSSADPSLGLIATREVNPETGKRFFTIALINGENGMWGSMNKEAMAHLGRCLIELAEERGRFAHGIQ